MKTAIIAGYNTKLHARHECSCSSLTDGHASEKMENKSIRIGLYARGVRFLISLACFCLATPLMAWWDGGHMVVAQIAYDHLDPAVKVKCDALIAVPVYHSSSINSNFVTVAVWADDIKTFTSAYSNSHFIDLGISLDGYPTNGVANDSSNVVVGINQCIATLQDANASASNQAVALRFLIHFVGDIQQPLHCSTGVTTNKPAGDGGGNSFSIVAANWNNNLHGLWDDGSGYLPDSLVRPLNATDRATLSNAVADVEAAYPYIPSTGIPNPMDWAMEGRSVAQSVVYVGITTNSVPSVSYTNTAQATAKQRVALGGQRLGNLLNTILAPSIINSWTDSNGKWENSNNWSRVAPPSSSDSADLITNAGNHTVTIDAVTTNTPSTMTINNLTISAPANSTNTLFLNNAGTNTPLHILDSLTITTGGALTITNSALKLDGNNILDVNGALMMNSGSIISTNLSSRIGETGSGSLTINGGGWQARDVQFGLYSGSVGTLTVAGGTNQFSSTLGLGFMSGSTGAVWMTGGHLVVTNDTTTVGNSGVGSLTLSNGFLLTTQMYVANENGSVGTLTFAGGTMEMSDNTFSVLPILKVGGADSGSPTATGTVWVTGGQLLLSNATVTIGDFGVGRMDVSNGTWTAKDVYIATSSSAQGTLTIAGGTNQIFSTLNVGFFQNATGTVWITGGQLVVTNDRMNIAVTGVGRMTMSNGTLFAKEIVVGTNGTANGSFTNFGGNVTITGSNTLIVGNTPGVTARMAFISGTLDAKISPVIVGDAGTGSLDLTNASAQALSLKLGARTGGTGALNMRGTSTFVISSDMTVGSASSSTGTVTMTGGSLFVTNGTLAVGNDGTITSGGGVGLLIVSNGTLQASTILLGSSAGGQGDMVLGDGGTISCPAGTNCILVCNDFSQPGGDLAWSSGTMYCGYVHPGAYSLANGTASCQDLYVGYDNTGTMTVAGGAMSILSRLIIGHLGSPLANGSVWMTGGQLSVLNNYTIIGNSGVGQMTISNGTMTAASVIVGNSSNPGSLTVAGGAMTVLSDMTLGDCGGGMMGFVTITGGNLFITNAAHNATLDVRSGSFIMTGGAVVVDRLVMTNACGLFQRTGGTAAVQPTSA